MLVGPKAGIPRNISFAVPDISYIKNLDVNVDGVLNVGQHTYNCGMTGLVDAGNRGDVNYVAGGVTALAERIIALARYLTLALGINLTELLTAGSVVGNQLFGILQQMSWCRL